MMWCANETGRVVARVLFGTSLVFGHVKSQA